MIPMGIFAKEETQGAISPLGPVATQGDPENHIYYLQRPIAKIQSTGPAPPSSNTQHLCRVLLGAEDPPTPPGYTPVMFFKTF